MKMLEAARLAGRTYRAKPEPEPDPTTPVRVVNDQTRDFRTVTLAEWPDYQARGYSIVPPGVIPTAHGEAIPETDDSAAPDRDMFADMGKNVSTQAGIWNAKEALARRALDTAADQLAARIGRPPIPRGTGGPRKPSAVRAADVAQAAITAEAVLMLAAQVDRLEAEIASLLKGR